MITSLFTAVSGMNANGTALSVIGDNVANMNTIAFKASRVAFGDILSQSLGTSQIGRGVAVADITPTFTQGSFENTANVLDLAVDGEGLFLMRDESGVAYTRAGQFTLDKEGYIVNTNGMRLQGFLFSTSGSTEGLGDINLSTLNSSPNKTLDVSISANLDSRANLLTAAFDVTDPGNTSNFSSTLTVYDSLGVSHVMNIYFRKDTEAATGNTWEWFAVVNEDDSESGITEVQAQGTLDFTSDGALDVESAITYPVGTGFQFSGGATADQAMEFDFGTSITTDSGEGLDGTTQFGSTSATIFQSQDGYASGSLRNITITQDGYITGIFTNGQTRAVGQVALAKFLAPTEVKKMGKNLYSESSESGQPIISIPGISGTGVVLSNTLELSNVDLAEEFVKMIISQRGFQANSKMVSTSDELMQELINLKR